MIKKPIIIFVAAFVTLTVVVAVLSARKGARQRPPAPTFQTNATLKLDTTPSHFSEQ